MWRGRERVDEGPAQQPAIHESLLDFTDGGDSSSKDYVNLAKERLNP